MKKNTIDLEGESSVRTFEREECCGRCDTAWEDCADRLVSSSGWHDQVANYKNLKKIKGED